MKKTLRSLLSSLSFIAAMVAGASALAQSDTPVADGKTAGGLDVASERARIAGERAALNQREMQERAACYQKFAVQGCLTDSQRRKRVETDQLKRQESQLNDAERKRRGALELDRLEAQPKQRSADALAEQAERAHQAEQQRDQRATAAQASRDSAAAAAPGQVRQLEGKQRAFADKQADQARRAAEAPMQRKRLELKRQQSAEHQANLERKNAQRTKPPSAGLPTPPP